MPRLFLLSPSFSFLSLFEMAACFEGRRAASLSCSHSPSLSLSRVSREETVGKEGNHVHELRYAMRSGGPGGRTRAGRYNCVNDPLWLVVVVVSYCPITTTELGRRNKTKSLHRLDRSYLYAFCRDEPESISPGCADPPEP